MCGITGQVSSRIQIDLARYYTAHSLLRHRGPDDEGFVAWVMGESCVRYGGERTCDALRDELTPLGVASGVNAVLGHHRLSILDTSPAGHQPMAFEGLWMVYNGEVYNYREIRTELESVGYQFSSGTDSEVVLKAIHHWGPPAFNRFNGMWSLAVWDENRRSLLLSRDRFGVKPLYYAMVGDSIHFASEVKYFRPLLSVRPNEALMREYIDACRLDHRQETMLDPVRSLPPAHFAVYSPERDGFEIQCYWSLPGENSDYDDEGAIVRFGELFDSALDMRLRSDVPVGALLSGGLDSSAIVSNLAHRGLVPYKGLSVFSAIFPDWKESEHELIAETTRKYPEIRPHTVVPTAERLIEDLPRLLYQVDFPIRSSAVHSQYMLYETVRNETDVVVLLNGQGADELFAGYQGHRLPRIAAAIQHLHLMDAWGEINVLARQKHSSGAEVLLQACKVLLRHLRYRYLPHQLGQDASAQDSNPLTASLRYNLSHASLPEYLRYEDRNSMSASCETRLPFLDYRIVEFAFSLGDRMKIRAGETKYVQRKAVSPYVAKSIVDSRIKKGFISPQQLWQRDKLKPWLRERIGDHGIGFLPTNLVQAFDADPDSQHNRWWRIACLAEWLNAR